MDGRRQTENTEIHVKLNVLKSYKDLLKIL